MSYTVNTEEVEACKFNVEYLADLDTVKEKRNTIVSRFRKLPVPGFRKGKATDTAIKSHFKTQIVNLLKEELANNAVDDVIFETKWDLIANPDLTSCYLDGDKFVSLFTFYKAPEVVLGQYKDFEIPQPALPNVDTIVEAEMQNLRTQSADVEPYGESDFVQEGDTVTLDYTLTRNGEPVVNDEGSLYVVGSKTTPFLDENILGMTAGETREFTTEDCVCTATVHMGLKKTLAPLDDTLAEKFGLTTLDELRVNVRGSVESRVQQQARGFVANQVHARLLANCAVEIPEWLATTEAERIATQKSLVWKEVDDTQRSQLQSEAVRSLKLSFIIQSITKVEPETQLAADELQQLIANVLVQHGVQDIQGYMEQANKDGTLNGLANQLRAQYTVDWIVNTCKSVE